MQCVNCGRLLTPEMQANGACPSCGAPIAPVAPPMPAAPVAPPEPAPVIATPAPQPMAAATPPPAMNLETVAPGAAPIPPQPPSAPVYPAGYTAPQAPVAPAPGMPGYPPSSPYPQGAYTQPGYPPTGAPPAGYPPTGYPPVGYPAPTLAPVQKKGGSGLAIGLSVGAIVIVLALVGSLFFLGKDGVGPLSGLAQSSTPQPTATATLVPSPTPIAVPAPPPGFTTYKADDGTYGLNYPVDWQTISQKNQGITEVIFAANAHEIFLVVPSPSTIPVNKYQELGQAFASGSSSTNIKFAAAPTTVQIGSNTWNKETGSFTFEGTPSSCVIYGTDRTAGTFLVLEIAPKSSFTTVDTNDFSLMMQSVTFLK